MKKLRIHVVNKYFYPVTAGIETVIMETYPLIKLAGWDITVHTSRNTLDSKNVLKRTDSYKGLKVIRYSVGFFGFSPKINWGESNVVVLNNFNISPVLTTLLKIYLLRLLGKKSFKVVLAPHGGFTPEWSIFSPIQIAIKKTLHLTLGRFLINSVVDKVQAVSLWEKQELLKYGVNEQLIFIVGNGLPKDAFSKDSNGVSSAVADLVKAHKFYIIQIGRIHPIKNQISTIKSLALIPETKINYLIVGPIEDKKYYETLKEAISKLNLDKRVVFTGQINGLDKYYLLKNATAMVHMALWEAFAISVIEGMSQGLVIITSNHPVLKSLIKDKINGFILDPSDSEKIAKIIKFVYKNKNSKVVKKIKLTNTKEAQKYLWENIAIRMERIYKQL